MSVTVMRSYNVLCPVTARLKPVSLMWASIPWIVFPGEAPSRLGLNNLMMSKIQGQELVKKMVSN